MQLPLNLRLFASDLDGTLLPMHDATAEELAAVQALDDFLQAFPECIRSYATGRHLEHALAGIAEFGFAEPDYFITDVGTTIWQKQRGRWTASASYAAQLRELWPQAAQTVVDEVLSGFSELELQETEKQAEFKKSYYCAPANVRQNIAERIDAALRERDVEASVISSVDPAEENGLVDVLPSGSSKHHALSALLDELGVAEHSLVYAGDSGNDREVFLSGLPCVVVANTAHTLQAELREYLDRKNLSARVYFARQRATAGVLEGLRHFCSG